MKEELQGKLVEILTSIQTATGKASDFAMQQLPDIAQSYVAYGRVSTIVGVLVGLAMLCAAAWTGWLIVKANKGVAEFREPIGLNVFGGMGAMVVAVIGAVCFLQNLNSAILVWFAPKVWLLKELASLVK